MLVSRDERLQEDANPFFDGRWMTVSRLQNVSVYPISISRFIWRVLTCVSPSPCGRDITATPSDSTLAIPTQTATTPLTAVPPAPTSDTDTEPHGGWSFGSAVWERMRKVFRNRNRAAEVEGQGGEREEGEETPLLRV